jgi:hypothetical protein
VHLCTRTTRKPAAGFDTGAGLPPRCVWVVGISVAGGALQLDGDHLG